MSAPILLDRQVLGVINVAEKGERIEEYFDEIDLKTICSISRQIATAIENLRLYKELHYLAITDATTNLHNFRYFSKTLEYELKRTKRLSGR